MVVDRLSSVVRFESRTWKGLGRWSLGAGVGNFATQTPRAESQLILMNPTSSTWNQSCAIDVLWRRTSNNCCDSQFLCPESIPHYSTDYTMDSSRTPIVVSDVPIKRPPEDEEPFDPSRAPPKRQTMENPVANGQSAPFIAPPSAATDHQLFGKTPGELITIILTMRSSHEQQLAELQNRYAAVSRQLEQLTQTLNGHFASQISALQSVQQVGLSSTGRLAPG